MLTDEQLLHELEAGFRAETAGLTYAGRVPAPRTRVVPWTAVPLAAATAAVVVLPQLGGGTDGDAPEPPPSATASTRVAPSTARPAPLVSRRITLAAFQKAVADAPDDWPPLTLSFSPDGRIRPPADATPVEGVAPPERAWVGTDPRTGRPALWFDPNDGKGFTFELWGEGWSADQLVTMLLTDHR